MSQIPMDLMRKLNKSQEVESSSTAIETIMKERMKAGQQVVPPTAPQPTKMVAIDDFILPADEMALFMYIIATQLSRNPEVAKILDKFEFKYNDVNGKPIYPNNTQKKKRKK